ncbi:MAG: hypothetical protein ACYDCK_04245 [Thermoplasmatota archaeon]
MKRFSLAVETLRLEADESIVVDEMLAQDGVLACELDLANERVALAYDEDVTSKGDLLNTLRFFGLTPRAEVAALRNA